MNEITLDSLHPTLKEFNPNFVLIGDLKNIDKDIDKNGDSQASVNDVVLNWDSFNVDADETVSFDANPSYKNLIVSTDIDRASIKKEIDQSIAEIDDNALLSLNGKFLDYGVPTYQEYPADIVLQVGANANQPMDLDTVIFL